MKKGKITVCIGIVIIICLVIATLLPVFESLKYRAVSLVYKVLPQSSPIVIVAIDNKSISENGLGKFKYWHRGYYSKVIDILNSVGAKVIGIDLLFSEKSRGISQDTLEEPDIADNIQEYINAKEHPHDLRLAEAFKKAGNIVLAKEALLTSREKKQAVSSVKRQLIPIDILKKESQTGWINLGRLKDNQIFSVPIGYQIGGELEESFAFVIARQYLGIKQKPSLNDINSDRYMFYRKPRIIITLGSKPLEEPPLSHDIEIPIQNGEMLIKYITHPEDERTFGVVSFSDVYNGKIEKEVFKDKIVLIGPYNEPSHDYFSTPVSDPFMYGVQIHANAIQNIIEQNFLAHQSDAWKIATIGFITLISVFVFSYLNIIVSLFYLPLSFAAYYFYARFQFDRGFLVDMLYPFVAIVLSFVSIYVYKYLTEYRSKLALKNAFSRYVNVEVVKEIMKHPDQLKLGGEKRIITVFFSDIKGFTSVSEGLRPEELVELLNGYLSAMTSVILQNGGTVDKYEGDAIMAFWNAPLSMQDHALKACKTAWECRMKLTELQREWKKLGKPILDFRVGINSGEAIVGNIGSSQKFEYTAIGDTVNLASRLEGVNKFYGTNIMISQFTKDMVESHFVFRPADLLRVKGKKEAIFAYEIVCLKEDLTPTLDEFLKQYNEGFNYYLKGIFTQAHKVFYSLSRSVPNDALTKVYLTRCGAFMEKKPENWDGVWIMGEK